MKKIVLSIVTLAFSLGWLLVSCTGSDSEHISVTAKTFRISHSGTEYSIAIGTTDISDTGAIATTGGVRNINIQNINLPDAADIQNIKNNTEKGIANAPDLTQTKVPIGTTDISDTGAIRNNLGSTTVKDSIVIGTTDISDMGGTLVLSDNTILAFTYNADGRGLMESLDALPSAAVKQACFPLSVIILVKNGEMNVKRSDGSVVTYNATTNIVIIRKEGEEICVYIKPKS